MFGKCWCSTRGFFASEGGSRHRGFTIVLRYAGAAPDTCTTRSIFRMLRAPLGTLTTSHENGPSEGLSNENEPFSTICDLAAQLLHSCTVWAGASYPKDPTILKTLRVVNHYSDSKITTVIAIHHGEGSEDAVFPWEIGSKLVRIVKHYDSSKTLRFQVS